MALTAKHWWRRWRNLLLTAKRQLGSPSIVNFVLVAIAAYWVVNTAFGPAVEAPPPVQAAERRGAACGTLGFGFGDSIIRHPNNPAHDAAEPGAAALMVSYEPDRLFASPLDGLEFDPRSKLFVFVGGARDGNGTAWIQLDGAARVTYEGPPPYDLQGPADLGHRGAVPLLTDTLAAGCHRVQAQTPGGRLLEAHFMVEHRPVTLWLITTISADRDLELVPYFIEHYVTVARVLPENIVLLLHSSAEPSVARERMDAMRQMLRQSPAAGASVVEWTGAFNTFGKFERQETIARILVRQSDWVIHPDVDEHHQYPRGDALAYLSECAVRGYTMVWGRMQDRVSRSGELVAVQKLGRLSLGAQFPLVCNATRALVHGATTKVVAIKGFLMAEEGGYHTLFEWKGSYGRHVEEVRSPPQQMAVHHYKWTDQALTKLRHRREEFKREGLRWWVQSAMALKVLEKYGNRVPVTHSECGCRPASTAPERAETALRRHAAPVLPDEDRFTMVLMAYSPARHAHQARLLKHFAGHPRVREVIFVWNSIHLPLPELPKHGAAPVRVVVMPQNSLNNRWSDRLAPLTDAVLVMDDDMDLPDSAIESLFARWRHDPSRLVGVTARNFAGGKYVYPKNCCREFTRVLHECTKPWDDRPTYCAQPITASPSGEPTMDDFCDTFRFVLPKGLFLHRKWLAEYSRPELQPLRTHVDQHAGHCDDVALNYVVANVTRQSAVVMTERVIDFAESSSAGLYDGSSEAAKQTREDLRTECVQVIDAYFRGVSPPPFYVEKPAFAQRLQGRKPPAVRDSRKYSLLFKAMGQCIGSRGEPPR